MEHLKRVRPVPIKTTLDFGIPLEALIVRRMEQVPTRRRQDWLRSLLIRGFSGECAEIQCLQMDEAPTDRYVPKFHSPSIPDPSGRDHVDRPEDIDLLPRTPLSDAEIPLTALKFIAWVLVYVKESLWLPLRRPIIP